MSYRLYTDKNENFECDVQIKNASLKDAFARVIVESDEGLSLMFRGELRNGKCVVPIKRMKGLLSENARGKMHLEVVVEDTYFKPWEDDFIVEEHTQVKVQVKEQHEPSKPAISVSSPKQTRTQEPGESDIRLLEITSLLTRFGINKSNLTKDKRSEFKQILREYFLYSQISNRGVQDKLIKGVVSYLK